MCIWTVTHMNFKRQCQTITNDGEDNGPGYILLLAELF